jgi:hypothetical protein
VSYYYKYSFVSPESIYAVIAEEFKSYLDTGAIDQLMWPIYADKCLQKLGKSSYTIEEEILHMDDFQSRLPDNFYAVREAWLCTVVNGIPLQEANSFYSQAASIQTIQVSPVISGGKACTNVACQDDNCPGCMPEFIQAVYKTNNTLNHTFRREYLLKPGNISAKKHCSLHCANFGASGPDSFDIRDNKFVTNFRNGHIHLIFYATSYDSCDNQLIPDNYRIKEYIEHFIKYKVMETLTNQVNDETFNQLQQKLGYYKGLADEAYIMAQLEIQKQTATQKQRAIKTQLNSFNKYELPSGIVRGLWRRNGSRW